MASLAFSISSFRLQRGDVISSCIRKLSIGSGCSPFERGVCLALIGHAFLLFVVLQKSLALPPWPFLGVLLVLDLAIGVAALYSRRAELLLGALAASQVILVIWQVTV